MTRSSENGAATVVRHDVQPVHWLLLGIGIGLLFGSGWQSSTLNLLLGFGGLVLVVVGFLQIRKARPVAVGGTA